MSLDDGLPTLMIAGIVIPKIGTSFTDMDAGSAAVTSSSPSGFSFGIARK